MKKITSIKTRITIWYTSLMFVLVMVVLSLVGGLSYQLSIDSVEKDVILSMAKELLDNKDAYAVMARAANPYGDGTASERIVDAIIAKFNNLPKPEDFIS